jgi:tetratricopeptide (TPR) repeat protein
MRPTVRTTNLAVALAHDGRHQEAIAQYQEALARDPKNSMVRLNLAPARYERNLRKHPPSLKACARNTQIPDSRCICLPIAICDWTRMPAIKRFVENRNQKPQIFVWCAPMERILSKIAKCKEAADAVH